MNEVIRVVKGITGKARLSKPRVWGFMVLLLMVTCMTQLHAQGSSNVAGNDPSFSATVLKQHNIYREALKLPPLTWSDDLAADARAWAKHLAAADKGDHDQSIRGKEGENIWWGTAGAFGYATMVDAWAGERKDFVYGVFPDCGSSRRAVVGHYTQMVWRTTTQVGCAVATNGKNDYLVCRYSPPGNMIGQKPY